MPRSIAPNKPVATASVALKRSGRWSEPPAAYLAWLSVCLIWGTNLAHPRRARDHPARARRRLPFHLRPDADPVAVGRSAARATRVDWRSQGCSWSSSARGLIGLAASFGMAGSHE